MLKIAVFIDFDNIQIGVRNTMGRDFDLGLVLEALKERGEVVTKVAYGNWKRAGELTRTLTQNAVLMVQRDLTPRGDKNGADINLALDALEMAINHPHINAFVIVGGDSDFIALVEKLKQYNKAVFVVGGRSFTSGILQRNCREFIGYENLIEALTPASDRRPAARSREVYPLQRAVPLLYRALKVLTEREVQAQLGLLKSTLIQLDSTFNERDYGSSSFRVFAQKLAAANLVNLRQQGNSYIVEALEREPAGELSPAGAAGADGAGGEEQPNEPSAAALGEEESGGHEFVPRAEFAPRPADFGTLPAGDAVELLAKVLQPLRGTNPRPLYLRNVKQLLRNEQPSFDEQRHGFASLVELLRAGQSQNLLRLQRDRRGALRVFIASPATALPAAADASGDTDQGDAAAAAAAGIAPESADGNLAADVASNGQADGNMVADPPVKAADDPSDSQIAVLGYYKGIHGESSNEEPNLSLAEAVMGEGRKRRSRKPKGDRPPSRRRKPLS
ncbi:MAG: NYN domain-containing protein [Terriglobales bacterium]